MKDIVGYEGYYKVTEDGDIYSIRAGRCLKKTLKPNGYEYIELNVDGEVGYKRVHRLVAEAFITNPDSKPYVNHIDGDKSNNSSSNLEWVTGSDNNYHAVALGLTNYVHNVYLVTSPTGEERLCVGYQEVIDFSDVSKNTVYNCATFNRPSRSGYTINFIERATTSPRGRTLKRVETGRDS